MIIPIRKSVKRSMINKRYCKGCMEGYKGASCYHFPSTVLVWKKEVPLKTPEPWIITPKRVPRCYTRQGVIFVDPHQYKMEDLGENNT
jgi:hypothetical protein